jgi:hypothetical protein
MLTSSLRAASTLGVAVTVVVALAVTGAAAAPAMAQAASPNPSSTTNEFRGVSAVGAGDAWAVGDYIDNTTGIYDPLIAHWNGTAWSQVNSPMPSTRFNQLYGVSAVGGSDAWAVGTYARSTPPHEFEPLILHWNGTAWTPMTSTHPKTNLNELFGVGADSATDAWAVGTYHSSATNSGKTLILHWTGTAWSQVKSPSPSSYDNELFGVSAVSGSDAWAVGDYYDTTTQAYDTLLLHWNGTAWSKVKGPNPSSVDNELTGVSAVSGSDAWAVGESSDKTLILHWNGTAWSQVKSPNPSSTGDDLYGVSAASSRNAWAVGNYVTNTTTGAVGTLILHWTGAAWTQVASPSPSSDFNKLSGVSATPGGSAWAVGDYITTGSDSDTLILHWNGTAWSRT